MSMRMLIDAAHPEEIRVAVVRGSQIDEFDLETVAKKQLKGNIYLAKVTRVEPSLQAAFVDYGGNRHGFLAFSEIHPDYYRIPTEDRASLIEQEAEAAVKAAEETDQAAAVDSGKGNGNGDDGEDGPSVESLGAGDDIDEQIQPTRRFARRYNIQEVISKRQVLLIQVVKEERGTKGAALTTYLSLAGRYSVLMPNSPRGGGVSRKISNPADRKKLKSILSDLKLPDGQGAIIRTAGMKRTKTEIKRDFKALSTQWEQICDLTLKSQAPSLIHEEGNLIKRAIRDLYSSEIDEILVEGEEGYRLAKDFMRLLMPSHAKRVKQYRDNIPLFHRYQAEGQLDSMFNPTVQLKSGGYIVINPTEALVAIDVNSGRSTREASIEQTALKTNLEASDEIARQLKLRDLAGLVVIDYIDMEDNKNNRQVERRLKEQLKTDRARLQVGRISHFGLLEMSRQRLRRGMLEASTTTCPSCQGIGIVRSISSAALQILRATEEEGVRRRNAQISIRTSPTVAAYLLNDKRSEIREVEDRYDLNIHVVGEHKFASGQFEIEGTGQHSGAEAAVAEARETGDESGPADDEQKADAPKDGRRRRRSRGRKGPAKPDTAAAETQNAGDAAPAEPDGAPGPEDASEDDMPARPKRRRGRRGGRRRRGRSDRPAEAVAAEPTDTEAQAPEQVEAAPADEAQAPEPTDTEAQAPEPVKAVPTDEAQAPEPEKAVPADEAQAAEPEKEKKKPARRRRKAAPKKAPGQTAEKAPEQTAEKAPEQAAVENVEVLETKTAPRKPAKSAKTKADGDQPEAVIEVAPKSKATPAKQTGDPEPEASEPEASEPKKRGWWQRRAH